MIPSLRARRLKIGYRPYIRPTFGDSGLKYTFDLAESEFRSLEYSSTVQGEVLESDSSTILYIGLGL